MKRLKQKLALNTNSKEFCMFKDGTYFVTDVETNGPLINVHELLSIGSCAVQISNGKINQIDQYKCNIYFTGKNADKDTMEFWAKWPDAWSNLLWNQIEKGEAAYEFREFVLRQPGKHYFVASPCWFDYSWVRNLFLSCGLSDPFQMRAFDYRFIALGAQIPLDDIPNPMKHVALYDAIEEAEMFVNFVKRIKYIQTQQELEEQALQEELDAIAAESEMQKGKDW